MPPRGKERLVLVGNGMSGMRMIDELLKLDANRYAIEIFGAEPHPNYNRIMLSSVLAGEKAIEEIILHPREWYAMNNIKLTTGDVVTALDVRAKTVTSASGRVAGYDKLVLATGSRPLVPPVAGLDLPGVCVFRDIADLERIKQASGTGHRAVVVGGGLLGLETAFGLLRRGMHVTVLHLMGTLMERQLDEAAGLLLQRDLVDRGVTVMTKAETEAIVGNHFVEAVRLADGRELQADLVVFAVGVRPNIDLARHAGIAVDRGIIVDDLLMTREADVFAVGECVEHRGQTFGLVGPLWDQARTCAGTLTGAEPSAYVPPTPFTSLKITGVDIFSAGALSARDDGDEEMTLRDAARAQYKKLVVRDGRLVGAILYGEISDGPWFVELMESKCDVSAFRDLLLFDRALAQAA
jgi:nitrite reductase (NADH) large subunit